MIRTALIAGPLAGLIVEIPSDTPHGRLLEFEHPVAATLPKRFVYRMRWGCAMPRAILAKYRAHVLEFGIDDRRVFLVHMGTSFPAGLDCLMATFAGERL